MFPHRKMRNPLQARLAFEGDVKVCFQVLFVDDGLRVLTTYFTLTLGRRAITQTPPLLGRHNMATAPDVPIIESGTVSTSAKRCLENKLLFHNGVFRIIDVPYGDDDATDCPDSIWGSEEDIPSLGASAVGLCIDLSCAGHK